MYTDNKLKRYNLIKCEVIIIFQIKKEKNEILKIKIITIVIYYSSITRIIYLQPNQGFTFMFNIHKSQLIN